MSHRDTLLDAAKSCIRLAWQCEYQATRHDRAWAEQKLRDAAEHRRRGRWYLMQRRLCPMPVSAIEELAA